MGIAINKMFAQLLFWLYEFLDTIFEMFRVLCGIERVSVEGTDGGQSILDVFLRSSSVTKAFLLIFLVAMLVAAVSTIVTVVKNVVNIKGGERKSHARTVGQGFGTIVVSLVMAFFMIFGITMSNYVLIKVNDATAPDSNLSISAQLFDMSVGKSYQYDYDNITYEPIPVLDEFGEEMKDEEGNPIVERDEQGNIIYEEVIPLMRDENGDPIIESGWRGGHTAADLDFSTMKPDDVFGVHKKNVIGFEQGDKSYTRDPMVEMESFNFWTAGACPWSSAVCWRPASPPRLSAWARTTTTTPWRWGRVCLTGPSSSSRRPTRSTTLRARCPHPTLWSGWTTRVSWPLW